MVTYGSCGRAAAECLIHGAIEIRHQRDHQVRLGPLPMAAQLADQGLMAQPDQRLQDAQFLRQPQSPAARQAHVVVVLRLHAGGSAKHILRIEDFEQIDQPDVPGRAFSRITVSRAAAAERCPPPALM